MCWRCCQICCLLPDSEKSCKICCLLPDSEKSSGFTGEGGCVGEGEAPDLGEGGCVGEGKGVKEAALVKEKEAALG